MKSKIIFGYNTSKYTLHLTVASYSHISIEKQWHRWKVSKNLTKKLKSQNGSMSGQWRDFKVTWLNFGSAKWMTNKTTGSEKRRIFDITFDRKRTKKLKIRGNRVLGLCCKLDWQIETQNLMIDPWLNYLPCIWPQLLILISFASNRPLNRPHGANPHLAWMGDYMEYWWFLTEWSCESL
jgi:hypothetical protein